MKFRFSFESLFYNWDKVGIKKWYMIFYYLYSFLSCLVSNLIYVYTLVDYRIAIIELIVNNCKIEVDLGIEILVVEFLL